jgi:hypothetical protein
MDTGSEKKTTTKTRWHAWFSNLHRTLQRDGTVAALAWDKEYNDPAGWACDLVPQNRHPCHIVMASRRRTQNLITHWSSRYMLDRCPIKHLKIVANDWLPWCSSVPVRLSWMASAPWLLVCGHRLILRPGPGRHGRSLYHLSICQSKVVTTEFMPRYVCIRERSIKACLKNIAIILFVTSTISSPF